MVDFFLQDVAYYFLFSWRGILWDRWKILLHLECLCRCRDEKICGLFLSASKDCPLRRGVESIRNTLWWVWLVDSPDRPGLKVFWRGYTCRPSTVGRRPELWWGLIGAPIVHKTRSDRWCRYNTSTDWLDRILNFVIINWVDTEIDWFASFDWIWCNRTIF